MPKFVRVWLSHTFSNGQADMNDSRFYIAVATQAECLSGWETLLFIGSAEVEKELRMRSLRTAIHQLDAMENALEYLFALNACAEFVFRDVDGYTSGPANIITKVLVGKINYLVYKPW